MLRLGHQARTIAPGGRPRLNYLRQNTRLLRFALLLRGNPLALLELGRGLSPAELAGGFALPDAGDLPQRIEDRYVERLGELPGDARRLVLLAAADPVGDSALIFRAAQVLGLDMKAVNLAADSGLLDIGASVRFRHPLVRSAAYRAAAIEDRRAAHEALATATDPQAIPTAGPGIARTPRPGLTRRWPRN